LPPRPAANAACRPRRPAARHPEQSPRRAVHPARRRRAQRDCETARRNADTASHAPRRTFQRAHRAGRPQNPDPPRISTLRASERAGRRRVPRKRRPPVLAERTGPGNARNAPARTIMSSAPFTPTSSNAGGFSLQTVDRCAGSPGGGILQKRKRDSRRRNYSVVGFDPTSTGRPADPLRMDGTGQAERATANAGRHSDTTVLVFPVPPPLAIGSLTRARPPARRAKSAAELGAWTDRPKLLQLTESYGGGSPFVEFYEAWNKFRSAAERSFGFLVDVADYYLDALTEEENLGRQSLSN